MAALAQKRMSKMHRKASKDEGNIASVFATLSGGTLEDALPDRFAELKSSLVSSPAQVRQLELTWRSVLDSLTRQTQDIAERGGTCIPEVTFPTSPSPSLDVSQWTDKDTYDAIKSRGVVIIRNVVPSDQALQWKKDIQDYATLNNAKGFPENNPQVYEIYWSKAQTAARTHANLLHASRAFLSLFHTEDATPHDVDRVASLDNVLNYCDRLRIRQPGDSKFALGPHIDGGGVERWECPEFRQLWHRILSPSNAGQWQDHNAWSLGSKGERMTAQTDMYKGPGQCGVFRPLQGWLSLSKTHAGEGTLRILPLLKEATAYIVLRPFFTALKPEADCASQAEYLDSANWRLDRDDGGSWSRKFPGCSLGHNIELSTVTHPHLALDQTMVSVPRVEPGDMVFWHCDAVHSVEKTHAGKSDSSVLYIPAIPLTKTNFEYIQQQRACFASATPPPDFPGGQGESQFQNTARPDDVQGDVARRSFGLQKFDASTQPSRQRELLKWCNSQL